MASTAQQRQSTPNIEIGGLVGPTCSEKDVWLWCLPHLPTSWDALGCFPISFLTFPYLAQVQQLTYIVRMVGWSCGLSNETALAAK
jgi:hypothetical protein